MTIFVDTYTIKVGGLLLRLTLDTPCTMRYADMTDVVFFKV